MRRLALLLLGLAAGCSSAPAAAPTPPAPEGDDYAVLVLAHGGTPEWDRAVREAVDPVARTRPAVIAFGMADRATLAAGLDSLARLGAERVAVVRLFLSGASFLDQTRYLLGLSTEPPAVFMAHGGRHGPAADGAAGTPPPIEHGLEVATHEEGLMDAEEAVRIVSERAAAAATNPITESLLLIAHGMGDDAADEAVLAAMAEAARAVVDIGFARIGTMTLREDWAEKRAVAERRILDFVDVETQLGRRVLVLPYRLHGFGGYAELLAGADYVPTEALLPHPEVSRWIARTAAEIACREGWSAAGCAAGARVGSR